MTAIEMDEYTGIGIWQHANNISICNSKTITIQTAASPADIASTQKLAGPAEISSVYYCIVRRLVVLYTQYGHVYIQDYSSGKAKFDFFNKELDLNPVCFLLGMPHQQIKIKSRGNKSC